MARTNNLTNFLTDVATAIKTKTGDSTAIPASQFDTKIADITTGNLSNEEYATAINDVDNILNGTATTQPKIFKNTGSFIVSANTTAYTLDTGLTSWKYLIILPHTFPYDTTNRGARCMGIKLVNRDDGYMMSLYGTSSDTSETVAQGSTKILGTTTEFSIDGSVVTFSGAQSAVGRFMKNMQYDWYVW